MRTQSRLAQIDKTVKRAIESGESDSIIEVGDRVEVQGTKDANYHGSTGLVTSIGRTTRTGVRVEVELDSRSFEQAKEHDPSSNRRKAIKLEHLVRLPSSTSLEVLKVPIFLQNLW
jgi:hypothetical protein